MIAVVQNISATRFTLNGIQYPKTFLPFVNGDKIRIINAYNSNSELVTPSDLGDFTVDGSQLGSVALLQQALIPIVFSKSSAAGIEISGDFTSITRVGNIITFTLADDSEVIIDLNNLDQSVELSNHISDTDNPHNVQASDLGLGNVDNTADLDKPISTAAQSALNGKVDKGFAVEDNSAPGDKTGRWVIAEIGGVTYLGKSTVASPSSEGDFSIILAAT